MEGILECIDWWSRHNLDGFDLYGVTPVTRWSAGAWVFRALFRGGMWMEKLGKREAGNLLAA